jgi:hypothetical protein
MEDEMEKALHGLTDPHEERRKRRKERELSDMDIGSITW